MTLLTRRSTLTLFAAGAATALTARPAFAGKDPIYQSFLGVAIDGADPVAFFTEGKPVDGARAHSFDWNGATWRFASAANMETFQGNPDKYAPAYGGYCAWAVSQGYTASTDPEAWTIHNGRLFLNYSIGVRSKWLGDVDGNIAKGDANWPGVLA